MAELLQKPMPWDDLIGTGNGVAGLIWDAIYGAKGSNASDVVRCINMLLDRADQDGIEEAYAQWDGELGTTRFKEPFMGFVLYRYEDLLIRYISSGFDPEVRHGPDYMTAIEMANATRRGDMAALMHSIVARRRVDALIAELPEEGNRACVQSPAP